MKSLLPLALSPSCSNSSDGSPIEEAVGTNVDGYFPELLAKDLQRSPSVFAAHHTTSGQPDSSPNSKDTFTTLATGCSSRCLASAPERSSSIHFRQLRPIEERNAVVSFLDRLDLQCQEHAADVDSASEQGHSPSAEAPSISFREQSIGTAATSLTASSLDSWLRQSQSCHLSRDLSWIEMNSDDEDDGTGGLGHENVTTLSPRPPTPTLSDSGSSSRSRPQSPDSFAARFAANTKPRYIVGGAPLSPLPEKSSRKPPAAEKPTAIVTVMPALEPSEHPHVGVALPVKAHHRAMSAQAASCTNAATLVSGKRTNSHAEKKRFQARNFSTPTQSRANPQMCGNQDELMDFSMDDTDTISVQPTPPASQLPELHTWFNSSARPYTSQSGSAEDVVKAVPLPPNVLETLRVSVTCFPETMLLSSSLTTETIRNYSRKVRQPSDDLFQKPMPDSQMGLARKSLWKKVVSYTRVPYTAGHREGHSPASSHDPTTSNSGPCSAYRPWAPLKNIFPHCSEYVCDALWAHIVAYNYMSAVLPRSPPQSRVGRGRPSTSNDSQKDDIPKKAAMLLGFGESRDAFLGAGRIARKLGAPLPLWGASPDDMVANPNPRSPAYDNAVRDIQAGLMRCIMRLIATAKLMAEDGTGAERMVETETSGVDVLFTRSLCEIVRISEEASCDNWGQ